MVKTKNYKNFIFYLISLFSTIIVFGTMLSIILIIIFKGLNLINFKLLFTLPKGGYYYGGEGGIFNALIGSIYVTGGATLIALFIGIPVALSLNVIFINKRKLQFFLRYIIDSLLGIPSIVYGAFGFTLMIYVGMSASLLAGIITVGILITPIFIKTFDETLQTVEHGLIETGFSLGSTKTELAFKILLKKSIKGLITAVLLAFGRGIGDAASVLFTAGYTDLIPSTLNEPVATLPLSIFFQINSPISEVREKAYASAVVLTLIILIFSILVRFILPEYFSKNKKF